MSHVYVMRRASLSLIPSVPVDLAVKCARTRAHTHIYTYTRTNRCSRTRTQTHTHAHTHTHTRIHTHTCNADFMLSQMSCSLVSFVSLVCFSCVQEYERGWQAFEEGLPSPASQHLSSGIAICAGSLAPQQHNGASMHGAQMNPEGGHGAPHLAAGLDLPFFGNGEGVAMESADGGVCLGEREKCVDASVDVHGGMGGADEAVDDASQEALPLFDPEHMQHDAHLLDDGDGGLPLHDDSSHLGGHAEGAQQSNSAHLGGHMEGVEEDSRQRGDTSDLGDVARDIVPRGDVTHDGVASDSLSSVLYQKLQAGLALNVNDFDDNPPVQDAEDKQDNSSNDTLKLSNDVQSKHPGDDRVEGWVTAGEEGADVGGGERECTSLPVVSSDVEGQELSAAGTGRDKEMDAMEFQDVAGVPGTENESQTRQALSEKDDSSEDMEVVTGATAGGEGATAGGEGATRDQGGYVC